MFCSGICFFFPFFFEDGGGGGVGVALWLVVVFAVSSRTSSKQTQIKTIPKLVGSNSEIHVLVRSLSYLA